MEVLAYPTHLVFLCKVELRTYPKTLFVPTAKLGSANKGG